MSKLWQSENKANHNIAAKVEAFTVGDDPDYDQHLLPYDLIASRAHAIGLQSIGLLTDDELQKLLTALDEIQKLWESGEFVVTRQHEDCHTAIEEYLTQKLGDTGKKIHTGRSRNDQVLSALRLYQKDKLADIKSLTINLVGTFLDFAGTHKSVPMPGYTHTQPAMLASVGMWAASFAELLMMDLEVLISAFKNIDKSPLGTAAGFGVNLPLPREKTAAEMGFSELLVSSMSAQNSRVKIDQQILQAISGIGDTLAKFANDLVLFSSNTFNFFTVDEALTTGSSIMPQKKNLDTAELLRGKSAELNGFAIIVNNIGRNLISGYHRDTQLAKKYVMDGLQLCTSILEMAELLINGIKPNLKELKARCTPEIFAVDQANELAKQGMPFRDAYFKIKNELDSLQIPDIQEALKAKSHTGGTGNLGIELLRKRLAELR